jgi:hypothetical protein
MGQYSRARGAASISQNDAVLYRRRTASDDAATRWQYVCVFRHRMARVVSVYPTPLRLPDGRVYTAQACGRERDDGMWEGWFEFVAHDGSAALRSERETTQPNLTDLEYWATGITPVYLEGALERTLTPPPVVVEPPVREPVYDEPAPPKQRVVAEASDARPVLNPFAVYATGESMLKQQLAALAPWQLRAMIIAYEFVDPATVDLDALTSPELIELVVAAVRARLAA